MTARTLTVDSAPERMRLDVFLAAELGAEFSRSQATRMIRAGLVRLNGAAARAADAVRTGDKVEIHSPPAAPALIFSGRCAAPEIEVLYTDDEIVVVNKPAGMTVHPAPGHPGGTLVDAMLARFPEMAAMVEPDGVMRPGIVHRLDKDTSGVMVVARTPFARMELARQFKQRSVRKIYLAVVRGLVGRERFSVARPVGRHPVKRKRMSVNSRHGREALSEACVLARMPMVDTPILCSLLMNSQSRASCSLDSTTCAQIRPGRFQPLDADIKVTTVCAAVSETEAAATCGRP